MVTITLSDMLMVAIACAILGPWAMVIVFLWLALYIALRNWGD